MAKKKLSASELRNKKLAKLAMATFAKKNEILHPVDISTLTPSSTFRKNAVIGINGVLYRSKNATSHFPVVLSTEGNAFVVNTVNGKIAFVVSDATVNSDWEIWTDAGIEYWVESINAAIADIATIRSNASSAVKPTDTITYNGTNYTVSSLLNEMAKLMNKTVVIQ